MINTTIDIDVQRGDECLFLDRTGYSWIAMHRVARWAEWFRNRRIDYWATRSSVHSFACFELLASLTPSAALTRLLARSLTSSLVGNSFFTMKWTSRSCTGSTHCASDVNSHPSGVARAIVFCRGGKTRLRYSSVFRYQWKWILERRLSEMRTMMSPIFTSLLSSNV